MKAPHRAHPPERFPAPQILLLDYETSPSLGFFFDYKKEYNIIEIEREWFIFSIAYQWYGKQKIQVKALCDFKDYRKDIHDDYQLMKFVYSLIERADIVIAHNGDNFDIKRMNARLIYHRFEPPSPYKTIDTLKISRRVSAQNSHRLDALARYYNIGRKLPNTGTHLWLGCYRGDLTAWKTMKRYNKHDVYLLEKVYTLLRPWDKQHPNLNLIHGRPDACPTCGSTSIRKSGDDYSYTLTRFIQTYRCNDCGKTLKGESEKLAQRVKYR